MQLEELESGARELLIRIDELKNSHRPIQQLPPDVLTEVATYLHPRVCGGDYRPLVAMSQVCHYWRDTLLSDAGSWALINSESIGLLPLLLKRSGSHLLEVNLNMDNLIPHTIEHLGPHTSRLGDLRCDLEEADIAALQSLSLLDPSPLLRTLSIEISRPPAFSPGVIEMALISGEMPSLRKLELLPFPITPQFAEFKHLVDLRLDVRYSTLTSVLDLLSANPSLEKVRLLGNFKGDEDDTRAAGSILMKRIRFFTLERCSPRLLLEKLTLLPKARVFIRYNFMHHFNRSEYALPRSVEGYPNLQNLSSLYALVTDQNDTYIDATGPNGSIAIQYTDLRDVSALSHTMATLPRTGITQLTCESHPASTGMEIGKVIEMMNILPRLEEIILIHFGGVDIQNFLFALTSRNRWTYLRRLKFVHCRQIVDWIDHLVNVAIGREEEDSILEAVTVVREEGAGEGWFDVLKEFVGTLELVEEEESQILRSVQMWDDVNCTTARVSVR